MDKHPTTRRWPRTLAEAFPRDAQHAYAIEGYRTPLFWAERIFGWTCIFGCTALIVYAVLP